MKANDRQEGGSHYRKLGIQHWDYVVANGIPYLEACAIKYLTRWRDKGGIEDLKKARHYIDKLIETETEKQNAGDRLPKPSDENASGPIVDFGALNRARSKGNSA
jgi:hypothetical protein